MKSKVITMCMIAAVGILFALSAPVSASIELYVDSAPNAYGSPDWAPWWTQAKTDVVAGTFTDMRTGTYPGTHYYDPYDEIVYSTGDLGKRLHWIYWVPGKTVADLDGLFEVKWTVDWAGNDWTYDNGGWAADAPNVGWSQPAGWEDYSNGVIGSLGFAWWSTDNDAPPYDTGGNAYDEVNQDDVDALREVVNDNQTFALGQIRYRNTTADDWEYIGIKLEAVPEPLTCLIWLGLAAIAYPIIGRWRR